MIMRKKAFENIVGKEENELHVHVHRALSSFSSMFSKSLKYSHSQRGFLILLLVGQYLKMKLL